MATTEYRSKVPFWRDPVKRGHLFQAAVLLTALAIGYTLFVNTQANLQRQSIATGFGFLEREAGFEIAEPPIPYSAADTYGRALLVGALNTLKVSSVGIFFSLILGTIIGISRLSHNWLVSRLSVAFIEVMQNIPVLLQLFFWYAIFYEAFPSPRQALNPLPGLFLCNRGLIFAVPAAHPSHVWMLAAAGVGIVGWFLLVRWGHRVQDRTGRLLPVHRMGMALTVLLPLAVWLLAGAPTAMDVPVLRGFNFRGGLTVSPEFSALLIGLILYTSAFVAEIVRAGIQAVSKGQIEAAMSIGLKPGQVLRLVVLPQALRVIIPPVTSQMLNLTKNSSLAIAIGYADFVSVANTTINQTGQAIEGVALIMLVYLFFSLSTSLFMNWYNKKMALVER
ncbi:amino acid ABC transporter membrane protein 1 (PAAT family) [Geothermobacter ehrlichii]|uniref:Amino acid ABC transporter membrane protein 1 (PAAT family) n=1 Tax=Geothermobacter ehrlichii TaxID=213224 RepID=A0A5D3WJE8_9BACT|nr:amino acid ABC transporter permease [Geothermobacter ehrlichii]TYO99053.1 amino acid ABC transporter membrane protein 1 (PAAT family) [Geothermobacter ehrlichii]